MKHDLMDILPVVAVVLCVLLLLVSIVAIYMRLQSIPAFSVASRFPEETLIIDAGHGGEDGGAVSLSGAVESGINLDIALRLDEILGLYGTRTILTRSEDISLHDSSASTLREKKVSDLHNRVALIESVENATLISIHQNFYPSRKYSGMQVFYANGELSLPLAKQIQENVKLDLDPDNNRQVMKVASSVYLMNHISCRAILVECGFLSNPEEDQLLQEDAYQMKVASVLAGSYLQDPYTQGG